MCRVMEEKWEEGWKEGQKEGREEGRIEAAQKMLTAGKLTLEEIAEYASLPLKEVQRLRSTLPQ